jgi:hypothetical protein
MMPLDNFLSVDVVIKELEMFKSQLGMKEQFFPKKKKNQQFCRISIHCYFMNFYIA